MISDYTYLKDQIESLKLNSIKNSQIQKIYSSTRYISFFLYRAGSSLNLFLGRGQGHEGIWFSKNKIDKTIRVRDYLLEYLRKHLVSTFLLDISLDQRDRVVVFSYLKYQKINYFMYFYSGRNVYFLNYFNNGEEFQLYLSWRKELGKNLETEESLLNYFNEVDRKDIEKKEHKKIDKNIDDFLSDEHEFFYSNSTKKSDKFLKRKREKIESDLKRVETILECEKILMNNPTLDLNKLNQFEINNVKFKLNSNNNHYKNLGLIFEKIKSSKVAKPMILKRLSETESVTKLKDEEIINLNKFILGPKPKVEKSEKKSVQKDNSDKNNYQYFSYQKMSLALGLNSHGNEYLRKNWAKKEDLWFHLENQSSGHLFLKLGTKVLDNNLLAIIASALYSKAAKTDHPSDLINLIYTEVKNLRSIPKSVGLVSYKKEKHRAVEFDLNWEKKLEKLG